MSISAYFHESGAILRFQLTATRVAVAALVAITVVVMSGGEASAEPGQQAKDAQAVSAEVDAFLASHPSSHRLSATTVEVDPNHYIIFRPDGAPASNANGSVNPNIVICPAYTMCWFKDSNYGGTQENWLTSSDASCETAGGDTFLTVWTQLPNQVSSFINNTGATYGVQGYRYGLPISYSAAPGQWSSYVGDLHNDANRYGSCSF